MTESISGASPILLLEWWKPVVGFEGYYEVSITGRVNSFHRCKQGKPLAVALVTWNYRQYTLKLNGVIARKSAHSLVAEAFIGDRPTGLVINHINRCIGINRASNLEYITQGKNLEHSGVGRGENNGRAKVTVEDVKVIREAIFYRSLESLAAEYRMTKQGIFRIVNRDCWKHVV